MFLTEYLAAALGLVGTLLLALRGPRAGWAFPVYLVSNALWIVFATRFGHWGLVAQQVGFTLTSLIGIYTWLIRPRWRKAHTLTARDQARIGDVIENELATELVHRKQTAVGDYTSAPISMAALRNIYQLGMAEGMARAEGAR